MAESLQERGAEKRQARSKDAPPAADVQTSAPFPEAPAFAIGGPGPGRRLFTVRLPGHRSRVVDPAREVPVYLDLLPVWASSPGEAWMTFQRYNGIVSTTQEPKIAEA